MSKLLKTKWRHKSGKLAGVVTEHNTTTGKVVLKLNNGRTYRGRVGNLKEKWIEVKD